MLYSFETFLLDTGTRELRRDRELLSVEPRVFDLLSYLIVNRERVVSRDDLIAGVWNLPDRVGCGYDDLPECRPDCGRRFRRRTTPDPGAG